MPEIARFLTEHRKKGIRFLNRELANGKRLSVAEIKGKAQKEGISPRTLSYCRNFLKIQITRDGQTGIFYWQLPF